jgi:hypothetical protein
MFQLLGVNGIWPDGPGEGETECIGSRSGEVGDEVGGGAGRKTMAAAVALVSTAHTNIQTDRDIGLLV